MELCHGPVLLLLLLGIMQSAGWVIIIREGTRHQIPKLPRENRVSSSRLKKDLTRKGNTRENSRRVSLIHSSCWKYCHCGGVCDVRQLPKTGRKLLTIEIVRGDSSFVIGLDELFILALFGNLPTSSAAAQLALSCTARQEPSCCNKGLVKDASIPTGFSDLSLQQRACR